jgi:hypothetical protein
VTLLVRAALRVVVVVGALAATGAVAGVVWEWAWTPSPGVVFRGDWYADPAAASAVFDATGLYVVLGSCAALVVTALLVWLLPGQELVTLVAVCVGSMLAGWVMYAVGHALGPPDPQVLAQGAERGTRLPSDLRLGGLAGDPRPFRFDTSAMAAWPLGAVLGFAAAALTTRGRGSGVRAPSAG